MISASRTCAPRERPLAKCARSTAMVGYLRNLCLLLSVGLTGGCGIFGDKDNTEPPAPLVDFESEIELDSSWERSAGSGSGSQYLRLRPVLFGNRVNRRGSQRTSSRLRGE